jgi:hypothetical protein
MQHDGHDGMNLHVQPARPGAWYCWLWEVAAEEGLLVLMAVLEGELPDPARACARLGAFCVESGGAAIADRFRREEAGPRDARLYGPRNGAFDGGWAGPTGGDGLVDVWADDASAATHVVIDGALTWDLVLDQWAGPPAQG